MQFQELLKAHSNWDVAHQEQEKDQQIAEQASDAMTALFDKVNQEVKLLRKGS